MDQGTLDPEGATWPSEAPVAKISGAFKDHHHHRASPVFE